MLVEVIYEQTSGSVRKLRMNKSAILLNVKINYQYEAFNGILGVYKNYSFKRKIARENKGDVIANKGLI